MLHSSSVSPARVSEPFNSPISPTSSASSRDQSPSRENVVATLKRLPIIISRGPQGYGFTLRAVHTYFKDASDYYVLNHLIVDVFDPSPAQEAGLKPGWIITHVNGEKVQGMVHTQVIRLIYQKRSKLALRALPLEETSIQTIRRKPGRRGKMLPNKRLPMDSGSSGGRSGSSGGGGGRGVGGGGSVMLRRTGSSKGERGGGLGGHWAGGGAACGEKKRHRSSSNSLFRKVSKRNAEQLQHRAAGGAPGNASAEGGGAAAPHPHLHSRGNASVPNRSSPLIGAAKVSPHPSTMPSLAGPYMESSPHGYSSSSSPSSSGPNSPASSFNAGVSVRPSSLQGLKYQQQQQAVPAPLTLPCVPVHPPPAMSPTPSPSMVTPNVHALAQSASPGRRKSIHAIPLSPLARSSPAFSPLALSPTATMNMGAHPSPLAAATSSSVPPSSPSPYGGTPPAAPLKPSLLPPHVGPPATGACKKSSPGGRGGGNELKKRSSWQEAKDQNQHF